MHSPSTIAGSRKGGWLRRPSASASALAIFASAVLFGCTADYELGTLDVPPSLSATGRPLGIVVTDGTALWDFDPASGAFSGQRALVGCDLPVVELTRRADGELVGAGWAAGAGALYRIMETGVCSATARFAIGSPWAVAFVPKPTGGGSLLGDEGGRLMALDVLGGQTEIVKRPNVGQRTGDMVVAADGVAWISLESAFDGTVVLEAIDPTTGALHQRLLLPTVDPLEGLAFAGGDLLAFTRDGAVEQIHVDGSAVTLERRKTHGGPKHFEGAASAWSGAAPR